MRKALLKVISAVLIFALLSAGGTTFADTEENYFKDVPKGHWAEKYIYELKDLNIIKGIDEENFGMGKSLTKGEFITWIQKVINMNQNIVLTPEEDKAALTRKEMAEIIVRELQLDGLAFESDIESVKKFLPYDDVKDDFGYISVVKDLNLMTGSNNKFNPDRAVSREEGATVLGRIYEKISKPVSYLNGFYAIDSYSQKDMIKDLNSVGFGWSRLEGDESQNKVVLNTTRDENNSFGFPEGFSEPLSIAKDNKVSDQLTVFSNDQNTLKYVLTKDEGRKKAVDQIVKKIETSFSGVVIDFENMKGEELKSGFNTFLSELKAELNKYNKSLYVTVPPKMKPPLAYYDAYDYRYIGEVADKVILMAHDYYPKSLKENERDSFYSNTPLTPMDDIYYGLKEITDENTGVRDKNKILLQISFDSVQWKIKDGKIMNDIPYHPGYELIRKRMAEDSSVEKQYVFGNAYLKYHNSEDETDNIVWYENENSVTDKINMAKLFGVNGISLWRLGTIPDYEDEGINLNIWNEILNAEGK
jgi:hypothetical protein